MPNELLRKILKKYGGLDLAHRAVMLQDAKEVLSNDRRQTQVVNDTAMRDGKLAEPEDDMPGDINIGDHYHASPAPQPVPVRPQLGTVAKLAIAGGLLASGVGAGAAIPIVLDLLKPAAEIQDTDTRYEFDLPDAE